jgi:hypothetical protein
MSLKQYLHPSTVKMTMANFNSNNPVAYICVLLLVPVANRLTDRIFR